LPKTKNFVEVFGMRISELKKVLAKLETIQEPVLLVGHAGVGKTEIVRQLAQETGRKLYTVILSQLEPGDLLGLPVTRDGVTEFLRPNWLPKEDKRAILFLDEINRAPIYVRQSIFQLVLDRQVGPHKLGDVFIIAAANPDTEEYVVSDMNDRALLNRFVILSVSNDPVDFNSYMSQKGYEEKLSLVATRVLDRFGTFGEQVKLPPITLTPRGMERAVRVFDVIKDMDKLIQLEVLSGIIGQEPAAEFIRQMEADVLVEEDFLQANLVKIKMATHLEKVVVLLRMFEKGTILDVPKDVLDSINDEDWAAVIRNINAQSLKYLKTFVKFRTLYPRIDKIVSS